MNTPRRGPPVGGPLADRVRLTRLAPARIRAGMSQSDLARAVGASRSAIAAWETGLRSAPRDYAEAIATTLHQHLDTLCPTPNDRTA